jgi:membrane fusion protein, multidrug efflux system
VYWIKRFSLRKCWVNTIQYNKKDQNLEKNKMKKFIYTVLAAAAFFACQPESNSELAKLQRERDSLVEVQSNVKSQLKLIDDQIADLDTTIKFSLVTAVNVEPTAFNHYFKVYGVVESNQAITLMSETSGKIEAIKVERGQRVSKGQLLAILDAAVLQQNKAELETALDLAQKIFKKQERLWVEEKIGSEVQYLEAKNSKESLERKLETINAQIAMTRIRAPFSGIVDEIFPKEGEMASPQVAMFRLVNLSSVYLTADVSEFYVGKVKRGTGAIVEFTNLEDKVESEVIQVGNFINPNNRTFKINVALSGGANRYKPNMMASVQLNDYSKDSTIVLNSRVVLETTSGESFVYVVENVNDNIGVVRRVLIKTGPSYEGKVEVLEGLGGSEKVIDKGSRSVKSGQKVRLVKD